MSELNMEQVRTTAKSIVERAKEDQAFKEEIQRDPVATLTAAGLPEQVVPDFLRETQLAEVSGYIFCLISLCF